MVNLELGLSILIIVSFVFLLIVFTKMFWNPILENIKKREEGIKGDISDAKKSNDDAKDLKVSYEKMLDESRKEVSKSLAEAREIAEKNKNEILEKAKAEAKDILDKARLQITSEYEKAKQELKNEVVEIALLVTEKSIGKILDKDLHTKIIKETIENERI